MRLGSGFLTISCENRNCYNSSAAALWVLSFLTFMVVEVAADSGISGARVSTSDRSAQGRQVVSATLTAKAPANTSSNQTIAKSNPVLALGLAAAPNAQMDIDSSSVQREAGSSLEKRQGSLSAQPDIMKDYRAPMVDPNREGFFSRNSAKTTFSTKKVEMGKKPTLEYFPAIQPAIEDAPIVDQEPKIIIQADSSKPGEPVPANLKSSEGIIATFGQPDEDDSILAEDKAPPSFKGMMAALQLGDEKLAWKYARRYARRTRELANRSAMVMGLTGKAFEREGVLPKGSWQSSPQFDAQQKLLDEDLKESGLVDNEESRVANLDPATKAFLERAQEAEEMQAGAKVGEQNEGVEFDEGQARQQLRASRAGKIPVDPRGLVDVYFFFRPRDEKSRAMAAEVEKFYRNISVQGGIHFIALTIETANPLEIDEFRKLSKTTFPIQSGAALAKEFGLKESPTTLFITQTTSRVVTEAGFRQYYYLDELLNMMRGK